MPCPHPRPAVERHVGSHVSLVCPDCNTRLAPVAPEPEPEDAVLKGLKWADGEDPEVDARGAIL